MAGHRDVVYAGWPASRVFVRYSVLFRWIRTMFMALGAEVRTWPHLLASWLVGLEVPGLLLCPRGAWC